MEPTKIVVTLTIEVTLEDEFAPTAQEAQEFLHERISDFVSPTGMKVTSIGSTHVEADDEVFLRVG